MSDAADAVAVRKEKERLLRERRRHRILAGSSSRMSLITGATSVKGEQQPAEDNPPEVAQEEPQGETASPNGSNTTDGGKAQREEGATNPPPATAAPAPEPAVTLTQRRTTQRSEETEVVQTRREEDDGHGTYTGTLTFEEGVELPSPSSLLSQAASGAEFAATVLPHLAKMTTAAGTSAAPKVRPSLARASGVVSIVVLAIVLGCAFVFADVPVMQDNVLVRLLASDESEAWLNVRSSSVMVPFFTLEAALILVSILSSRFLAPRQQESSAAGAWFFSLPFGRVFADMSIFLFSFVLSVDLLSLVWPWIAPGTSTPPVLR